MRSLFLLFLTLLMFTTSLMAAPRKHTWVVVSPSTLDARLHRQLETMAARDQALVRFFTSVRQARRVRLGPGNLWVELREERNTEEFLSRLKKEAGTTAEERTLELAKQGYILEAHYPRASAPNRIRITAAAADGFHNGLLRVPELLRIWPSNLPSHLIPHPQAVRVVRQQTRAVIVDFPSFPERGIIEGFYGKPWTHQDRLDILRFEGYQAMNVYYYAPKDDPYHRELWREAYPPEAMKRLGELTDAARQNFVNFCFAISPGLTMTYSSDADFKALTDKLESVGKLGVSCFGLFLDDVPQDLQHPEDKTKFRTLGQAHIDLINKLDDYLKSRSPENHLVVTPTTYTNEWGSRDYIKELGAGVNPDVPIVWTGPKVASPTISVDAAREWGAYLHRKPLVWDNFPVNDGTPWTRYLGPMRGRDPNLPSAIQGLFSNPMNQAYASMIPLATVADYLWNSHAYDPEQSATHAVTRQYGKEAPELLASILKAYGTYWWDDGIFGPLFKERRYPIDIANIQRTLATLNKTLGSLSSRQRFQRLMAEIEPAINQERSRLEEVKVDPAFRHSPDGIIQWDPEYDMLTAERFKTPPAFNGDFAKWERRGIYLLNNASQVMRGAKEWKGPEQLSARVGLGWEDNYLYVGVDVTDLDFYQPFFERGIQNGDAVVLMLETAFQKNYLASEPTGDEYHLYISPGNFADVKPSVFSDQDYLPPRPHPHNYQKEIRTVWKKTPEGYSGDIAIPVSFFDVDRFSKDYQIGLSFEVQKVIKPADPGNKKNLEKIVLGSKKDRLFPVAPGNPASFQRLVLTDTP